MCLRAPRAPVPRWRNATARAAVPRAAAVSPPTQQQKLVFRQLFDAGSSTYTYLVADSASREALLIDPVLEQVGWGWCVGWCVSAGNPSNVSVHAHTPQVERDLRLVDELGLELVTVLNTHCHAGARWPGVALTQRGAGEGGPQLTLQLVCAPIHPQTTSPGAVASRRCGRASRARFLQPAGQRPTGTWRPETAWHWAAAVVSP
jgi:hypothetical protein